MPGENIQDWSVTALTNGNADSAINWLEGMPRADVNNSARSMMAAHAKQRNLLNGSIVTAGTVNAQTFLSGLIYTAVPTGLRAMLKVGPGLTNTGPATLNMDGIAAVAVKKLSGADLIASELVAGRYADLVYNGTNWVMLNSYPQFADSAGSAASALSVVGKTDGSDAAAGMVGELQRNATNSTSPVTVPTGTAVWAANLSLGAGDWDVSGQGGILGSAGEAFPYFMWIGTNAENTVPLNNDHWIAGMAPAGSGVYMVGGIASFRVNVAVTTAYHLYAVANYVTGTVQAFGSINCRRAR